jgi:hypothetical protein
MWKKRLAKENSIKITYEDGHQPGDELLNDG